MITVSAFYPRIHAFRASFPNTHIIEKLTQTTAPWCVQIILRSDVRKAVL